MSYVAKKKEGGFDGGLTPCQAPSPAPMPIVDDRGLQAVAMAAST